MDRHAIDMAGKVIARYHTRNPQEIIDQRKIELRYTSRFSYLLGYYVIRNHIEYIGINANATDAQKRSAKAHELGHVFLDRQSASSGTAFQDTFLYSQSNAKSERRANIFAAELLLPDDLVLTSIGYYAYQNARKKMESRLPSRCSSEYRAMKYYEMMNEFYSTHPDLETPQEIAHENGIEEHLVDFKLNILAEKGFELSSLPELRSDFLKDSMKKYRASAEFHPFT